MTLATCAYTGRASGRFRDLRELGSAFADSSSAGKNGVEVES
jgi:hypothetical protein